MTSEPDEAYVWVWLPHHDQPVVAGRLQPAGRVLTFTYGQSYLARDDAIPLYLPELPLGRGPIPPRVGTVAGCLADAGPDAWGVRVILARLVGDGAADVDQLSTLTYLLESGSDRIGALDFQVSPTTYVPRAIDHPSLEELVEAADRLDRGLPLSAELAQALLHGTSVGGARPKALLEWDGRPMIAKFSSTTDTYPVVKGEFLSMELARRAGLDVARVELTQAVGKDVLLVDRFDRAEGGRRAVVSALTILELDEMTGRYASYAALADVVRARFVDADRTLRELFARIVFNVLTGNTDDHARNHAAFWDGELLRMTPAYDICPQLRSGGEAEQSMAIGRDGWRYSQVAGCVDRAGTYHLSETDARAVVDRQIEVINEAWNEVCDLAGLAARERAGFWGRQYLNRYALEGW